MEKGYDFDNTCFVIMPYGIKKYLGQQVNFDLIYEQIFKRAAKIRLENGRLLKAYRADEKPKAGPLRDQMRLDILKSRVALADITGDNRNVTYEIGLRHALLRSSTALVMQKDTEIPHDLQDDPVVTYKCDFSSENEIKESIEEIREFLRRSIPPMGTGIPQNVISALFSAQTPQGSIDIASRILEAERAKAQGRVDKAIELYKRIDQILGGNSLIKMRLGTLLAERPSLQSQEAAQALFEEVTKSHANYSDAHRELGLSQHRMYLMKGRPPGLPTGEETLNTVLKLTPNDLAAKQSLAEILLDKGQYADSLKLLKQTGFSQQIMSMKSQIDHLISGGVGLDLKPLYTRGASTTYDIILHNLPRCILRDELNQVLSPLDIKSLEVKLLPDADSTIV
ncbi:MAG: hypothetical protein WAW41_18045, partial [Methylobacter sp.]